MTEIKENATLKEAVKLGLKLVRPMLQLTILQNFIGSLQGLQEYVEADETGELLKRPLLQFDYDIQKLTEEDIAAVEGDIEKAVNKLFEKEFPEAAAWSQVTQGVYRIMGQPHEDGSPATITISVPEEETALTAELEKLSEEDRKKKLKSLARGWDISEWVKPSFTRTAADGTIDLAADIVFHVFPLTYTHDRARAFFPVWVGLDFKKGGLATLTKEERAEFWKLLIGMFSPLLEKVTKQANAQAAAGPITYPTTSRKPDQVRPVSHEYFKAPGRLFDTPRDIASKNKRSLLPEIDNWYKVNSPLNDRVAMAAAALTNYRDREAAFGMQETTLKELEELVYIGAPAHGQHFQDILESLEMLRTIPLTLVNVGWEPVGGGKKQRYKKKFQFLRTSILQSYGVDFIHRKTNERVFIDDPAYSKIVKKEKGRRTSWENIIKSFPLKDYRRGAIRFRWNTDVAEDFIMPRAALDDKGNVRLGLNYKPLKEGKRFISVYKEYFNVAKRLTEQKKGLALRLLKFLISEKVHLRRDGRAIRIEIAAEKVITALGKMPEYQSPEGRKKRVLDDISEAVIALQTEKVLLSGSTPWPGEYPKGDTRRDRRVNSFYRWKLAPEWSTVALVPEYEIKAIEAQATAEREAKEQETSAAAQEKEKPAQPKERLLFELPPIPSADDIKSARAASGLSLRKWVRRLEAELPRGVKARSIKFWSDIETGKTGEKSIRQLPPAVLEKIKALVVEYRAKGSK
jgi:hypothetical protein